MFEFPASINTRETAMIGFEGIGRSGDRGHHPPPPAPSLSSSTLSPLAPPFTVDRWVPAVANPNSLPPPLPPPPPPPTGAMSPFFVPTGASRLTNLNSGLGVAEATPCYPYYNPARDSVDDTLEKTTSYKGYVGGWSGTFDLEEGRPARGSGVNSSWMDCMASCQISSSLKKRSTADNFSAYDNSFGSWLGAHNESSFTHGHVGSECSEWLDERHREIYMDKSRVPNDSCFSAELDTTLWPNDGSSYFYSPEISSDVKECDAFIRNPYERYVGQLISCSGDPEGHFPAQTASRQAYAPSNERNESLLSCVSKHGNPVIKHANLHRRNDDHVDYAIAMQNEASIHENAEGNEGFVKMGISSDPALRNGGTPDYSLQINCFPSGNSSALEQSFDSLQAVKFGFKVGKLSCCNATNTEKGILIPDDSMRTTEEMPDHLNVAVDSPCWKGASMSRWYPFSPDQTLQPLVNTLTTDNDELVQDPRSLKIQSDIDGIFACNGNGKDIDLSTVTDLSGSNLKFQDSAEKELNPAKVESEMEIKQHDILGEHNNVLNEQASVPQGIDDHVRQVSQVESNIWNAGSNTSETIPAVQNSDFVFNHVSTSPNSSTSSVSNAINGEMNLSSLNAVFPAVPKNPVSSDAPIQCLSQGQDNGVFVKAMLSLSDVLLCHYRNHDEALEECDLQPMQQIIDNLEAVILLNKKGILESSSRVPRVERTQPEVEVSNAEMSRDKVLTDVKENENARSTGLKNYKHDDIVKSFSTNFKVSDEIAQEEDPKILLYKNLWVQTEAALCSLKHDIALMKLEMESFKNLLKAKSLVSSDGLAEPVKEQYDFNCTTSISAGSPSGSNSKFEKNRRQNISKNEEVDTSVFARYRILKDRDEIALSGLVEQQELNAIKSSVDSEKGEMKEQSPNLADKNAIEKKGVLQSHNSSKFVVASPKNLKGEKLPAVDHGLGSALLLNNTESAGVKESNLSASGGSVVQSYNSKSHGKRLFSSGSGSPSSEWEHVLKDEFTW